MQRSGESRSGCGMFALQRHCWYFCVFWASGGRSPFTARGRNFRKRGWTMAQKSIVQRRRAGPLCMWKRGADRHLRAYDATGKKLEDG